MSNSNAINATSTVDNTTSGSASPGAAPDNAIKPKPAKRSWLKRIVRFILWSLLVLFVLLLIVVGLLSWLAGTDSGFSRVTKLANEHVPGLAITQSSGNLRTGFLAENISFANDAMDIQVSQLESEWRLGCLLEKTFCLDNIDIDELQLTTYPPTEPVPEPPARQGAIELPDITLPIAVDISNVSIGTFRFQAPGDAPVQVVNNIRLSARAEQSIITLDDVSLEYQQFATQLTGQVEIQGDYPLDLSLTVSADDILPDSVPEGEGDQPLKVVALLTESLADLAIDTQVNGLAQVSITGKVKPLELELPADILIVGETLGWPITSHEQIRAQGTRISAVGDMNDYTFSIETQLDGAQVPATGINISGIASPERVTVPDINIDTLGGVANGNALVSFDAPLTWSTRWNLANLDPSIQVPDLQGQLNGDIEASGSVADGKWSLNLNEAVIDGELKELPFRLDAKLSKGLDDVWDIERVLLNNDKNIIQAQGKVDDTIDLKADINLPQLQNFLPGLAGGFDANIVVDGDLSSPNINLDANADTIRFNDILVRALSINGDIEQLFLQDSKLDVTVGSVVAGENTISNTALSLSGERVEHQLTLKSQGPQDTSVDLALAGALDESFNWKGALNRVQAALPAHQLVLQEPAAIQWMNEEQRVSISAHCWSLTDESRLCLQDEFSTAPSGQTTITLDQYSLAQLNSLMPEQTTVAGDLGANIALSWGTAGPDDKQAVISAVVNNVAIEARDALGDPISLAFESISLDANANPKDVKANLSLISQELGTAQVNFQLDPSDPDSALDGAIDLQGLQVSIAEAFLPDFDEVSGTINAKGKWAGTITAPEFDGTVTLDAPVLRAEILPLPVTGGNITARIAGQSLNLDGQILSNEGKIDIDGRGSLDPQRWNVDVNLLGENLDVQSDPVQESTINHNINIAASANRIAVTGDISIPQAVIDVEELPEGASTVSSDVFIIEDIEEQPEAAPEAPAGNPNLQVNIDVSLGDEVGLSAYGLTANLTGDMDVRVRGNKPPQLGGEIRVVDGIFKKYGQDLQANGQVIFVGPVDGTRLAIDAIREIANEDRTAGLRIQGTVATPEITLFTDPSDKSQDAILSYVVLGRDINEASDQEADLLATAALALAIKGGQSLGGGVASKLGVEEFGLEARGSGNDKELLVSGRVSERILLRYGRGVFDAESTLYLRYDLTKKLYLEAAQGVQEAAADLFYSFSF